MPLDDTYIKSERHVMLADILNRESRLNDWELSFISDITDTIEAEGWLSEKQVKALTKIWEKVT